VPLVTVPGSGESFDLDRPGAVAKWNRALNRRYAMRNLTGHASALVRAIERRRRSRVASLVPPFGRALDLGAEDGSLAAIWRGRGRYLLLLDVDPAMLHGSPEPSVAADAARLPLRDGSFDVVVLSALLEHVVDPAAVLAECRRVLREGGRIVAYVPWDGAVVPLKRWARRIGIGLGPLYDGLAPGHLRRYKRAGLRALFAAAARHVAVHLDPLSLGYYVEATV